ncbi:hypothetical protein MAPG_02910 [Magnaporthiopsis poae ATCC 64411]|uniref:Uncharacterized protein n=1 Tax=Magnaporthiopsis poae (strain ATCC 64411 / 73-15) TaxID=644358 RepID=A0A0C4DSM8_MAGP6|nr:hypothetical protein MAPG_02910 [Magnaporthiopsis poae ATCC 64411]
MSTSNPRRATIGRRNAATGTSTGEINSAEKGRHPASPSYMPGPSGDPRLELANLRKQLKARTAQANDAEEKARVMRQRLSDMISALQETKQEKKDLVEELEKTRQECTTTTRLYRESQTSLARAKQVYDKEREEWDKKQSSLVAQCQNQLTKISWLEKLLAPEEITNTPKDTDEMQGVNNSTAPQSPGLETPDGVLHDPELDDVGSLRPPARKSSAKKPASKKPASKKPAASSQRRGQAKRAYNTPSRPHVAESVTSEYKPSRRASAGIHKTSSRPSRASAGRPSYANPNYDDYSVFGDD